MAPSEAARPTPDERLRELEATLRAGGDLETLADLHENWTALRASLVAEEPPFRVLSYGGGLDSFGLLLHLLGRRERLDLVIFADVADARGQDPGEWPGTYRHVREVVMPLCLREGLPFVWLDSDLIPIRATKENPAGHRSLFAYYESKQMMFGRMSRVCTVAGKVQRIRQYVQRVRPADRPVEMLIGFEAGEETRVANDPQARPGSKASGWYSRFPLIEAGLCRCRCEALVRSLGYPVPRKSACVFCPFSSKGDWQVFQRELPHFFTRAADLEERSHLTKSGAKMRFFFRSRDHDVPLVQGVQGSYRRRVVACDVCGIAVRATKAVGCGYVA